MIGFFFFIVLAYILGSLPSGVIIGLKVKGIDIREYGSKNSGATNAYRVLGAKYGIAVLFADIAKGFLPVMFADVAGISGIPLIIIGVITILGHTFSVFLDFKGGKGVATSLGVFLYLIPQIILITVMVFLIITYLTRYISLASITCAGILPILTIFMPIRESLDRKGLFVITLLVASFVIYKHKSNISRLINGTENKFKLK